MWAPSLKEVKKDTRSSRKRHRQEIADAPGNARLVRVVAKQATNRVRIIALTINTLRLEWKHWKGCS
jgi:hypothetical protein